MSGPLPVWMAPEQILWQRVEEALDGVGDPALGEWRQTSAIAVHLRRRLRVNEWGERPWGMDYRHTPEGELRLAGVRHLLPPGFMA